MIDTPRAVSNQTADGPGRHHPRKTNPKHAGGFPARRGPKPSIEVNRLAQPMWPVVKEYCDNACCEVVLVRCKSTGRLFAYCRDCGAWWLSLAALEANGYDAGSPPCPQGVEVPLREEAGRSTWADAIKRCVPEEEYSAAAELNQRLARESANAALSPAWRPPPAAGRAFDSRRWFDVDRIRLRIRRWLGFRERPSVLQRLRRIREQSGKGA